MNSQERYTAAFDTTTDAEIENVLEALVDKHGVSKLLAALGSVCEDKAAHVEEAWQDKRMAWMWGQVAQRIGRMSATGDVLNLVG